MFQKIKIVVPYQINQNYLANRNIMHCRSELSYPFTQLLGSCVGESLGSVVSDKGICVIVVAADLLGVFFFGEGVEDIRGTDSGVGLVRSFFKPVRESTEAAGEEGINRERS